MPSELRTVLAFLVAYLSAVFVLPHLVVIAERIGLMDQPEKRKVHNHPRPLVGGIGMMIAAAFSAVLLVPPTGLRGFFAGLAVLLMVGFLDDFRQMGHRQKFLAQIIASLLMMILSKTYLVSFGDLFGLGSLDLPYAWLSGCVTVFCVVGVINTLNMIDGLDGLAGGIAFIAFMTFAIHASLAGNNTFMLLNLAFAGAVLGFLHFNWSPAVLFMGDAGSLCLGFTLAFMSIAMSQGADASIRPVWALLILALPIVDTLTVMAKRTLQGKNPFKADKYHLHHILMRYGLSRPGAVKAIHLICVIMGGASVFGSVYRVSDAVLFLFFMVSFAAYFVASLYIREIHRFVTIRRLRK